MQNNLFVKIYGVIIIFTGLLLLSLQDISFSTLKNTVGAALIVGAVFALVSAFRRTRKQVQFAYHEVHAITMFVYGISVLLFVNKIEIFNYLTAYLLVFYSVSEIIFCNWLFNLKNNVKFQILFIRILLALIVGIGTVVLMSYYTDNHAMIMQSYGFLITIIGVNILLYVPIMKKNTLKD